MSVRFRVCLLILRISTRKLNISDIMDRNSWLVIFSITFLWIISAIGLYAYSKDVQTLFLSINCFAVVIATTINLISTLQNQHTRKVDKTYKFAKMWDATLMTEARTYTRQILDQSKKKTDEDILADLRNDTELRKSVVSVFNFFQTMYMSIQSRSVNEDVLKRGFSSPYIRFFNTFRVWREEHIKKVDPNGYQDLHSLYNRWSGS